MLTVHGSSKMVVIYKSNATSKKRVLGSVLRELMLVTDLITFGRLFQSVGEDTVKLQSPSMRRAFILGCCSSISLVDLKL